MPTVLDEIQENAKRLLDGATDLDSRQLLTRRKEYLESAKQLLLKRHREGLGGLEICRARSLTIDLLLQSFIHTLQSEDKVPPQKYALGLLAYGGYGRGELNPFSDIDIMFLHDGRLAAGPKPSPLLTQFTEGVLYPLYDLGLKVGHSTRSPQECALAANSEMEIKTAMIEARLLWGNQDLFDQFQATLLKKCVVGKEDEYIAARLRDQEKRREQYGDSPLMQSPNVKNGCGGLRDFQNLIWMTFFKFRTRSLQDLEKQGGITLSDRNLLEVAYDYLMRVRNELHFLQDRPTDALQKNLQPEVAKNLGHPQEAVIPRMESFMREYYTYARHMDLITRMVEQCLALVPTQRRLPTFRQVIQSRRKVPEKKVDGFKVVEGIIHGSPRLFQEQPRRLMRLFLHMQKRGLALHPELFRHVRHSLSLVDERFLRDRHVHNSFMEILSHPGNVASILRSMHETGLLGCYLPEFGRLTCLVQHEFFHQYTADEHTLVCIEILDKIWDGAEEPFSRYQEFFKDVDHPYVLYLALLLHDAGKAYPGGNHSETGAELVGQVARRMELSEEDRETLVNVVRHHLLPAKVSQRFDLDDPVVIQRVADQIKTKQNLLLLTLHTFADSRGTGATLWNEFKDSLLRQLFFNTLKSLTGETEFIQAGDRQRARRVDEVRELCPRTIRQDEFEAHFSNLPDRYVDIHSARDLFTDVALAHRFLHHLNTAGSSALAPVFYWHNEPDRGYAVVKVSSWNRKGFFSHAAGAFAASGMSILNARIFSRWDGIIIDTFYVVDPVTGKPPKRNKRENFEALLKKSLISEVDFPALIQKQAGGLLTYDPIPGEHIPTRIRFNNEISKTNTYMEILTEDHVGLLYFVSEALSRNNLDIWIARINTEKGAAIDTFYLTEMEGGKILSENQLWEIENQVRAAIDRMNEMERGGSTFSRKY